MNDPIKEIDIKFIRDRIEHWQSRTDLHPNIIEAEVNALRALLQLELGTELPPGEAVRADGFSP